MVYGHSQMLAHENCIYRFQGMYDYAFFVDSDDHFIPLAPNKRNLITTLSAIVQVGPVLSSCLNTFLTVARTGAD